jgi:hypothetical protein
VALEINRLIRNLANLKNARTNQNKFLKTKPKIKEFKENFKEAGKEAFAFHDYIKRASVKTPSSSTIPPLEGDSFRFLPERILDIAEEVNYNDTTQRNVKIDKLEKDLEIGILTTTNGVRYLTTRARAIQLGGAFKKMSTSIARMFSTSKGGLE